MITCGAILGKHAVSKNDGVRNLIKKAENLGVNLPAHEVAYRRLRDLILFGELAPQEPVTIQGLVERSGSGMTPVREAIRRLIAEDALQFQGNRRVSVPDITLADLEQLVLLRLAVEPSLTAFACRHVTEPYLAQLTSIDNDLDRAVENGDVVGYPSANHTFHMSNYNLAQAPILLNTTHRLWLRFGPALRMVCGRLGTQNLPDFHKDILTALVDGKPDAAADAMAQDVVQGMDQIRASLGPIVT
jgi:DNA-binding GntR family transcriptional regulator